MKFLEVETDLAVFGKSTSHGKCVQPLFQLHIVFTGMKAIRIRQYLHFCLILEVLHTMAISISGKFTDRESRMLNGLMEKKLSLKWKSELRRLLGRKLFNAHPD